MAEKDAQARAAALQREEASCWLPEVRMDAWQPLAPSARAHLEEYGILEGPAHDHAREHLLVLDVEVLQLVQACSPERNCLLELVAAALPIMRPKKPGYLWPELAPKMVYASAWSWPEGYHPGGGGALAYAGGGQDLAQRVQWLERRPACSGADLRIFAAICTRLRVRRVYAWNAAFDERMLAQEYARLGLASLWRKMGLEFVCLQQCWGREKGLEPGRDGSWYCKLADVVEDEGFHRELGFGVMQGSIEGEGEPGGNLGQDGERGGEGYRRGKCEKDVRQAVHALQHLLRRGAL